MASIDEIRVRPTTEDRNSIPTSHVGGRCQEFEPSFTAFAAHYREMHLGIGAGGGTLSIGCPKQCNKILRDHDTLDQDIMLNVHIGRSIFLI